MCDLQTWGSRQGFVCKARGSRQGQIARSDEETATEIERESKSCISPSILVLRFLVDRFIWARPRRRRRKPNCVTNFFMSFYLFAAFFCYCLRQCSLVYFTISVLVIACVPWKYSVTNKEHLLTKRFFQLIFKDNRLLLTKHFVEVIVVQVFPIPSLV